MSDLLPRVVILCGGQGTRLKEETEFRPKPMVEVGGRPLLWHIMQSYAAQGFRSFVLALGFKGHVIRDWFLNYRAFTEDFTFLPGDGGGITWHGELDISGWEITFVDTGENTPTGGRVLRLARHIRGDTFMLTYGDGVSDIDAQALLRFHRQHGRMATVTGLRPVSRFGVLETNESGLVTRFREKPQLDGMVSGGFFVLDRRVVDLLDDDGAFEGAPMEKLANQGELMAYGHDGFWFSVDTYRDYLEINRMWEAGIRPWQRPEK